MTAFTPRHLLAAAFGAAALFGSAGAFAAGDGCRTIALGIMRCDTPTSERTRDAVVAETRNAQSAGQLKAVGELAGAPNGEPVPMPPVAMTRTQVRTELAQARTNHQLQFVGDL